MAHDVFVSYSSKDKVVADSLVAALENTDIRCWYAPRDIKPGADWGEEIAKAINSSTMFLLIFSSHSNRSQRVLDELNLAINKEVIILPFRIEKLDPSGAMLLHLSSRHWLDAFAPSWEEHLDNLVGNVSSNLKTGDSARGFDSPRPFALPAKPQKRRRWLFGVASAAVVFALGAIIGIPKLLNQANEPTEDLALSEPTPATTMAPTETSAPTPTEIRSPTPTLPALGSPENPLVWMYFPPHASDINDVISAADKVAEDFIGTNPDLSISILPAPDMPTIIDALCDGKAHIGFLNPIQALVASDRGCAEPRLVWSAYGDISFSAIVITNTDSGITDLSQLEGHTLCVANFSSNVGWILPSLELKASIGDLESFFSQIIEVGDHVGVIESVYNRDCDAGTTFYDARGLFDVPDVMDRVSILATTTSAPQPSISFSDRIDPELSRKLIDYFLKPSSVSDQLALMRGYEGLTEPVRLIEINEYYYSELRDLFERADADPEDYLYLGY